MTYRELAEQVLFGATLEQKLAKPSAKLTDECAGKAIRTPDFATRPDFLKPSGIGEGAARPKAHLLEDEEDRLFLLHQFANHELLAAELMALALLKFPDAPPAFRSGLAQTLQEEQEHTRWYIARLGELGVAFGSRPVNGYFWRCVADMETPLDYVSRLSLTFEQANLDYSQYFAARFAHVGDAASAKLLEQIYKDELVHVGYGLRWFRKWRGQEVDDWQAYCQQLTFPLLPVRAKGNVGNVPYNAAGRRQVGFTEHFIEQLEFCHQSRGRTPWIRYFNPGAELCAAQRNAHATERDAILNALSVDLDTVALFLAQPDDVALLRQAPRTEFLRYLKSSGIALPEIVLLADMSSLGGRKLGRLRPWGWSADSDKLLGYLQENAASEPPGTLWDDSVRRLYAKTESLPLLHSLEWQNGFGSQEVIGKASFSLAETTAAVESLWATGQTAVVKASFSLAGRGMVIMPPGSSLAPLVKLTANPDGCIVEPHLARLADFSAHYEVEYDPETGRTVRLKGLVGLQCLPSGQFASCTATVQFTRLLPPRVARFCQEQGKNWLKLLYQETIPAAINQWIGESTFRGMLGVDAFFYETTAGEVALKPVVEVNPRCTMGRLTLELRNHVAPQTQVQFSIQSAKRVKKTKQTLADWAAQQQEQNPLVLGADGKIQSGVLFLNDAATAKEFLGVAVVR